MYSKGDLNVMFGSLLMLIGAMFASGSPAAATSASWKRSSSIFRLICIPAEVNEAISCLTRKEDDRRELHQLTGRN